jgi:Mrp family chromosome partitioning ATPase
MKPVSRCRVVAVASAKGSPGVTFTTAGLACRLADLGLEVLALDADAEDRTLAATLDVDPGDGGEAIARAAALGVLTADGLRQLAAPAAKRLGLIEAPTVDALDGRGLVGAAREAGYSAVVIDLGHLPGRLQRQLAAASDWLLWVVLADRLGLERADQVISRSELTPGSAGLVLNRQDRHSVKGADRALSERHRLPLMARLTEDRKAALACSARRPPHVQRRFAAAFDGLARALHPDLAGTSSAVWP